MKKPKAKTQPKVKFTNVQKDGSRKINDKWFSGMNWTPAGLEVEVDPITLAVTKMRLRFSASDH